MSPILIVKLRPCRFVTRRAFATEWTRDLPIKDRTTAESRSATLGSSLTKIARLAIAPNRASVLPYWLICTTSRCTLLYVNEDAVRRAAGKRTGLDVAIERCN